MSRKKTPYECRTCGHTGLPSEFLATHTRTCLKCSRAYQKAYALRTRKPDGRKNRIDISDGCKTCNICKVRFPLSHFYKHRSSAGGVGCSCKGCLLLRQREWRKKNPDKLKAQHARKDKAGKRNARLQRQYGITLDDYYTMYLAQDCACAICRKPAGKDDLEVDHCHRTDKVRSLLCGNCNAGLGQFNDNVEVMLKAIEYVRTHSSEDPVSGSRVGETSAEEGMGRATLPAAEGMSFGLLRPSASH